jgi:uncharacterized protein
MTNEERDIIAAFIARVAGAGAPASAWSGASVPAPVSDRPPLPPVDPEADRFIAEQFQRYPEARYRLTQLAFVQEHALIEAQNRLRRLEWELQQAQQTQQSQGAGQRGGFFSSLFGGGGRSSGPGPQGQGGAWGSGSAHPQYAPPPPQYPSGYQPGVFQQGRGSGFLGSALTTAAGVAGGVLAADAIRDMFSSHGGLAGGAFPGAGGPWGAPAAEPGYADQGTWNDPSAGAGQGYVDQGTWDQGGGDQSGWTDPGPAPDDTSGGWDQGGGADPGGDWGGGDGGGSDDSLI